MPQPIQKKSPSRLPFRFLTAVAVIILIGGSFLAGQEYERTHAPADSASRSLPPSFSLLTSVWTKLNAAYINHPINETNAAYGAAHGLVQSVGDPYTVFFSPEEARQFNQDANGTFEGIGAEIGTKDGFLVVVAPLHESPAEKAGLMPNDRILSIDGQSTKNLSVDAAVTKIRGKEGTVVTLTIANPDGTNTHDVPITRSTITVKSVTLKYLDGDIADLSVTYFGQTTAKEFESAANDIAVHRPKGIILDLRTNPGGYLDAAVDIASYFLASGSTVVMEESAGGNRQSLTTTKSPILKDIPLVVLVDGGSASASEIVAGALKDAEAGTVVGVKTFGKGSVQQLEDLPGGASLKVTVAKWLTPKGTSIDHEGITPDVVVEQPEDATTDVQQQKAEELVRGQ